MTLNAPPPGRILGVDLGLKRTGLALSDEFRVTIRALPNLAVKSRKEDIAFLVDTIREWEVLQVVIGHPILPKSEDEGPMAKRARGFAEALKVSLDAAEIPAQVHLVDERGSSQRAAERLVASGVPKKSRKAALDGEAARILVEEFLLMNSEG